ncbi:Fe-S cluster assembly sulfur transfer protein SufU [Thermoflexus sp.]|uniref:Fe-S cluster assembly sulfur transfer protein SufU n=3 Tax=Thermoflexus sp. TaxID=1969742 RepID=UPI0025EB641B|nr:SUF system NifU family Fe-S cluster assembly protein [Thermoflexus sp.]MDW8180506.1 SUF system NifU family Fe-S cluster assembly protein [Anaerolineae bacterium]MCS6962757.1 SUF system NifU family Fe-S cluster assembly protein [Thermoflexus sp.]MCS7351053.1 SUF system NifU family Fe-S cluster assembly protein [Thermoflexus sp.]MCX7690541.1 SUF system NifU family Fe-S cluster assembly protein [Thermoflexus sp.]MDW8186326.1 SUF system NifU family Fe-S cluster assembly protein [Anaerolineae ba
MEDLYREIILDHYENPRNYGELPDADISYEDDNPLCGDRIRMDLKVQDGRIVDVRFSGKGCAISQASASMLTERIKGATVEEARRLTREDILEMLGIPLGPARIKCALLSLKVLKAGLYGLPKIDWDELG